MKKIFVITQIIIILCVSSDCIRYVRKGRRYYEGYIYTIEGQPVQGLRVYPSGCHLFRCTEADSAGGMTNEHGYFKFRQPRYWITTRLNVQSGGRRMDDIIRDDGFARYQHRRHRGYHYFDDRTTDTFFVDMEGKGRSFTVMQGQQRYRCPGRRYYEGYIYTIDGQPMQGLRVYPSHCQCQHQYYRCTEADSAGVTDERGYFKIWQKKYGIAGKLFIDSEGRIIDTIDRGEPSSQQTLDYNCFDDRTADTFFVDTEGKGRSFRVLQGEKRPSRE